MCFFDDVPIDFLTKDNIFKNATKSNTEYVKKLLSSKNINVNNSNLVDDYGQTLLHIAAKTKNYNLATYLIDNDADITGKNIFNESSFDIAMKNYDAKMIGILLGQAKVNRNYNETVKLKETVNNLDELNKKYTSENVTLCTNNKLLIAKNDSLTKTNKLLNMENDKLHMQLEEERKSYKRKFDGYSEYERENKRLKVEVSQLKSDNSVLQQTVKSLRESNKK